MLISLHFIRAAYGQRYIFHRAPWSDTSKNTKKKSISMSRLTEQEQQEIHRFIEADKPLPDKFRFLLFEDKHGVELVWNGKSSEVCNIVLPFQVIE